MPYYGRRRYGGYGGYGGFDFLEQMRRDEEMWRREEERRRIAELQRLAAGSRRRQVELEKQGRFTPAGVWDADCERWPEFSYSWDLGGGFTGTIQRGLMWCWNGYVTLPEWYPNRTASYNFWNGVSPSAPIHKEFTYGGVGDSLTGEKNPVGKYGWDHTWGGDLCPFGKPVAGGTVGPNFGPHATYSTAEMVINEVWRVASWFASMALDGSVAVPAGVITAEIREGLFRIQQSDMRIAEKKRKEREAAAAAAKAEADRKAAEAAAAAAAEAERQRLWDLEHPLETALREATKASLAANRMAAEARSAAQVATRMAEETAAYLEAKKARKPRIIELLAIIEELQQEGAEGKEISKAERRQMNRYEQLKRDLANREGEKWDVEEAKVANQKTAAAIAAQKAEEAEAAAAAAQAELTAAEAAITKREADARAAEEARVAAEKAAAEAKAAAEKRAAEREVATKRLGHVIRLLGEIDAIKGRKAAGDKTLDPLQLKKAARHGDLLKEKATLEASLA